MIKCIFRVNKKQFLYLKIVIEYSKKSQIDIIYTVTILYNFIIYYYFDNKKDFYNKKSSNNEKSEIVNRNKYKNNQTVFLDAI